MVDERDEQYEGEEGEYHFSDEQANYEMEPETSPKTSKAALSPKEMLAKLTPRRQIMIAAIVFIVLIGIVYKILAPTAPPSTEFAQVKPEKPSSTMTVSKKPSTVTNPAPKASALPIQAEISAPTVVEPVQQKSAQQNPPAFPQAAPIPSAIITTTTQPAAPQPQVQPAMPQTAAPSVAAPPMQAVITVSPAPSQPAETQPSSDRLASLEQQNAAIMNLLQTEYAKRMADYETQNMSTRGRLEELTKRLNHIEASLNQISQLLEGARKSAAMGSMEVNTIVPSKQAEPKSMFSVQAIIPGRAWLKSDSGDTVTVAEGDVLKNYGRITKIDPYDGIVEIDTGNKVITLSYGMSVN